MPELGADAGAGEHDDAARIRDHPAQFGNLLVPVHRSLPRGMVHQGPRNDNSRAAVRAVAAPGRDRQDRGQKRYDAASSTRIVPSLNETTTARPAASHRAWLIDCPDFWRLWFVGLVVFSVRWVETVAVGVFVYQQTGSPFIVAMMTMLRLLPMGLFGAFIGAIAERMERRTTLVVVVAVMLVNALVLATLAHLHLLAVWHLAVTSFINGVGWATDNPVRRVMIGEAVGSARMGAAMSIDVGANNASRWWGPPSAVCCSPAPASRGCSR